MKDHPQKVLRKTVDISETKEKTNRPPFFDKVKPNYINIGLLRRPSILQTNR